MPTMPAEGGRLADRAAGVGAGGAEAEPAATAAAEPPELPPGTSAALSPRPRPRVATPGRSRRSCWTSPWRTRRGWSCPDSTAPAAQQLGGDGQFVGRHEAVEDLRAGRGQHALGAEQVLDRERHAVQQAALALARSRSSETSAPSPAPLRRLGDEGVEAARRSIAAMWARASSVAEKRRARRPSRAAARVRSVSSLTFPMDPWVCLR